MITVSFHSNQVQSDLRAYFYLFVFQTFKNSIEKDQHMGIAHFQLARTYYQQQKFDAALQSLEKARTCLRGNKFIDYKQLGLQYKLHECEV